MGSVTPDNGPITQIALFLPCNFTKIPGPIHSESYFKCSDPGFSQSSKANDDWLILMKLQRKNMVLKNVN